MSEAKSGFKPLSFEWSAYDDSGTSTYDVRVADVEYGPAPDKFLILVLRVSSERESYVCRKTARNFDVLYDEVHLHCPQWPCTRLPRPLPRWPASALSGGQHGERGVAEALWTRCRDFAAAFVENYQQAQQRGDAALSARGTSEFAKQMPDVGTHLRREFRCLFSLQRMPEIDRLELTTSWRRAQPFALYSRRGERLFVREYRALRADGATVLDDADDASVRAVAVIVHGYADGGDSNGLKLLAYHLNRRGIDAFALDVHGHGRSEGERALVTDWRELVEENRKLVDAAAQRFPGRKIFALGQSMGGAICTALSIDDRDDSASSPPKIAGTVLLAPMVKVSESQSPLLQFFAPLVATLLPRAKIAKLDVKLMTHEPYHQRRLPYAPYGYVDRVWNATGWQMLKMTRHLAQTQDLLTTPVLVIHGSIDNVTSPEASRELHRRAATEDKTLLIVENAYHDVLLDEVVSSHAFDTIVSWITARI